MVFSFFRADLAAGYDLAPIASSATVGVRSLVSAITAKLGFWARIVQICKYCELCKYTSIVNCANMQFEEQPTLAHDYFSIGLICKYNWFFIGHLWGQVVLFSILVSIAFETVFVVLLVDVQFSERALDAKEISVSSRLPWPSWLIRFELEELKIWHHQTFINCNVSMID